MKNQRTLVWGSAFSSLVLVSLGGVAACGESFGNSCQVTRTCPLSLDGGAAGASSSLPEAGAGDSDGAQGGQGSVASTGGDSPAGGESSDVGAGGAAGAAGGEISPPEGAFAWYVASEDDVKTVSATLADGNDFVKSYWVKRDVSVTALQPDVDGGTDASAIAATTDANVEHSLRHALLSHSEYAPKTLKIRAKMGKWRYMWMGGPGTASYALFDLLNGTIVEPLAVTAKISPLKNLWYQCEFTGVSGPEFVLGFSDLPQRNGGGPRSSEPIAWIQSAEVEQVTVTEWRDRIGGRSFVDSLQKWSFLASATQLAGLPALQASDRYSGMLTAGAPGDWSFLHDGSGGSFVILHHQAAPNKLRSSSLGTEYARAAGVRFGVASTDAKVWEWSANDEAGEAVFTVRGGSSAGPRWHAATYVSGAQPAAQLFENGFSVGVGHEQIDPSAAASKHPLMLGSEEGSAVQSVHEVIVYDRALDSNDVARLKAYFDAKLAP